MFQSIDALLLFQPELFVLFHDSGNEFEGMGSNTAFCQVEARQDGTFVEFMSIFCQNLLAVIENSINLSWYSASRSIDIFSHLED